ncbi:Outer membrane receptor proteins, mostly Fe transport [Chitinophaga costaii]|uniref:Outer membrane receptor proteins, mostly Fe transport n=1 Tax=Chitinophaga costaii TaxID=1335309 RepID=A0A1C4ENG2_9BACT|nr:outer membrane beta-barrel protein [Chitinophaga costaii]PUZ22467.1 TonB-dependent receptor [Chitinophaga costaii]SCC45143.1 Outer membrane receptor proteins, mostly Fe transport [Chitinophaga costaii]
MVQKIMVLLTTGIAMFIPAVHAQSVSGLVTDQQQQPALAATIALLRNSDSSLIKTTLPDDNGRFSFPHLPPASYHIRISMMGYKTYNSPDFILDKNQEYKLPAVSLLQQDAQLKAVAVTAQRPFIEKKIDRTVVNVDALISNAGSSALEVLEKSPGVSIDQEGSISLKGKSNVMIYVNDKPTYLSGADLESYLRSLPASSIDAIELMPNPPASYDAAGTGGIINIRLKRNKNKGFNGNLNAAFTQGRYANSSNSFNFTYRNQQLNVTGNFGYTFNNGYSALDINRRFHDSVGETTHYFLQHNFIARHAQSFNEKIGVDFYASAKSTLGLVLTGTQNPSNSNNDNTSRLQDASQTPDSSIHALNNIHHRFNNVGINLNYRHQYDKNGRELTVDVDYLRYNTGSNEVYDNYSFLPEQALPYANDQLTGQVPAHLDIFAGKIAYTHPFKSGYKLAGGLKSSYTSTDNLAKYYNRVDGEYLPDYDKSNHFLYHENINAGYLNVNKDYKKWSVQAGLRLENTVSIGHQLGNAEKNDSSFNRNYTGIFPTFYVSYKLDTASNNVLALNYGRRIDRPYYEQLNPFISPLDKFTYYVGNPYLRPSYMQSIALSHTYKSKLTTTLSYTHVKDDMNETIAIVNGIYYSRPGNIGSQTMMEINVDAQQGLGKVVNLHLYAQLTYLHSRSIFYTGILDNQSTFTMIMPTVTVTLPKDWALQADGRYQSTVTSAQFILGRRGAVNLGVSKKLSPNATIKCSAQDIFKTQINTGIINNLALTDAQWRNVSDTRRITLSFTYRFGKAISDQRKHEDNSAESEMNRVR